MEGEFRISLRGINKSFPGVHALKDVSFDIKPGEVHAIVGENGAGKSTLMKILSGMLKADSGQIFLDGVPTEIPNAQVSKALGIAMIYQELLYMPALTVAENLVIGRYPSKCGVVNWKQIKHDAEELLNKEGILIPVDKKMRDLSISDIQMLEILKATSRNAKIIIMDEPTSSLTRFESERLFRKISEMKKDGLTIIYISHKMEEIFSLCDRATVMRDGEVIGTYNVSDVDSDSLVTLMVGRTISNVYPKEKVPIGDICLELKHFSDGRRFDDININCRKGEILGLAGLVGAGRSEIVSAIFGLEPYTKGEIIVEGKNCKIRNTKDAISHGIMMATEDRRKFGMVSVRSIKENISLPYMDEMFSKGPFVDKKKEAVETKRIFDMLSIKAPGLSTKVYTLSGGNQQKVVIGKWMVKDPKIFILDEPTRGIDVGAKHEIYKIMVQMAKKGISIIMISSELPELLGMCDRCYVIREGKVAGELTREEMNQEAIMQIAVGGN